MTLPVIALVSLLAIANRQVVTFSFDPFSSNSPFLAIEAPFFIFLLISVFLGIVIGGSSAWLAGGQSRAKTRRLKRESRTLKKALESSQGQTDTRARSEAQRLAGAAEKFREIQRKSATISGNK